MSKVAVLAKLAAAPGRRDELVKELQFALDSVGGEEGTLMYILHEDPKEADTLWFYELYSEQAAFETHGGSDWMKELGPRLGPLLAGRPELTMLRPVGGKGL